METGSTAALDGSYGSRPRRESNFSTLSNSKSVNGGHKRTLSGSILSRLSFLRSSSDDTPHGHDADGTIDEEEEPTPRRSGAMGEIMRQNKGRRRKGSLRKAAMLGTGKLRRNSSLNKREQETQKSASSRPSLEIHRVNDKLLSPTLPGDDAPRRFSYESSSAASSSDSVWAPNPTTITKQLSVKTSPTTLQPTPSHSQALVEPVLASPITSPTNGPYASTTDDDEGLIFGHASHAHARNPSDPLKTPPYFPSSASSLQRRRSANASAQAAAARAKSPLSALDVSPSDDEWDYSETAWWGWVVLIVTWIVFVVGMGSCLGVWSWAWDVGETPYAPPELEDDPTLPIVGYYPALIILTGVMAWIWVIVAWVGMKSFRHAKITAED